jgi:hypothetical protein
LRIAADIGETPESAMLVADFSVQQGNDNRENLMTWMNPLSGDFSGVRLLRKTDGFPASWNDADAALLYEGTGIRYRDSRLAPGITYYYGIYVKSGASYSEVGVFGSRQVTENDLDRRKRSFFLIGGSSSYADPTGNLVAGVDMYDPLTQQLAVNVATLPNPRVFCAVASANGKIYVFGGKDGGGVSNKVDILDIAAMEWTIGTVMTSPRCALVAVPYNDRIYCLGGSTGVTTGGALASNYIYDVAGNAWAYDTSICADLIAPSRCAFNGVAFRSMLYYFGGVDTLGNWTNNGQYRNLLTNQSIGLGGLLYYFGCTQAFYYKDFSDGSELAIFFTLGGSNTGAQTALPAGTITLAGNYQVYAAYMPNPTGGPPSGYRVMPPAPGGYGIENFTNRAYAGCEYYGDYLYLFGGLAGSPALASTLIERLDVKDGDLYNGEWTSAGVDALQTARYGFGITRVND